MSYPLILDNKQYSDKCYNTEPTNYVISKQDLKNNPILNPMDHENCERRHNITVHQYESVLKTLNSEFKTLLERNQLLEEKIALNQYNSYSPDRSGDIDIQLRNMQIENQNLSERLVSEVSRTKKENEGLVMQLNQASKMIEELKREVFNKNLL
jgi:predicted RNase H-like nuclease (RuvC/YqgF family)